MIKKRKPGRPRKTATDTPVSKDIVNVDLLPKKRGRPRNPVKAVIPSAETDTPEYIGKFQKKLHSMVPLIEEQLRLFLTTAPDSSKAIVLCKLIDRLTPQVGTAGRGNKESVGAVNINFVNGPPARLSKFRPDLKQTDTQEGIVIDVPSTDE